MYFWTLNRVLKFHKGFKGFSNLYMDVIGCIMLNNVDRIFYVGVLSKYTFKIVLSTC